MSTVVENILKTETADFPVTTAMPELKPGEKFAGVIVSHDGKYRHALILLPDEAGPNTWRAQMGWAASIGGDLPDRVESALLFATLRDKFKPNWYWTCEQHAAGADWAWVQHFSDGDQIDLRKGYTCRARAVRRIKI